MASLVPLSYRRLSYKKACTLKVRIQGTFVMIYQSKSFKMVGKLSQVGLIHFVLIQRWKCNLGERNYHGAESHILNINM